MMTVNHASCCDFCPPEGQEVSAQAPFSYRKVYSLKKPFQWSCWLKEQAEERKHTLLYSVPFKEKC